MENVEATAARPVEKQERIRSVDVLRGFALLGILLMNIQNFGIPEEAYGNPKAWAGATGWNLYYWVANQILFEGKMRFLFSLLFGAGTVLLTERAEQRGAGLQTADIYLRRCLWMMAIGMLHAYFIWEGDILFWYGTVGLGLFVFRVLPVWRLLRAASVVFLIVSAVTIGMYFSDRANRETGLAAARVEEKKRTPDQKTAAEAYLDQRKREDPIKRKEEIEKDIREMHGNYLTVLKRRAKESLHMESVVLFEFGIGDVLFPMLLGMAFYKAGILSARRSRRFYALLALGGYTLGLPPLIWATAQIVHAQWDPWTRDLLFPFYEYGRLTVGLGHLGLVLLVFQLGWLRPLMGLLAKVGQMALTNYLLTSLLMTLFFNGYGLGKFGALERHQLLYVVFGMWSINLILSPLWLRYFYFGPMEWVWRSLTYWKRQPMRIVSETSGESSPELLPAA